MSGMASGAADRPDLGVASTNDARGFDLVRVIQTVGSKTCKI